MSPSGQSILALDVGAARIGVARASTIAQIAAPLLTLDAKADTVSAIAELVAREDAGMLVVGLPRNLQGDETGQTKAVREFAAKLSEAVDVAIVFQDEALTSKKAEAELQARKKPYSKGDIDALAATFILEDYLRDNPPVEAPYGI